MGLIHILLFMTRKMMYPIYANIKFMIRFFIEIKASHIHAENKN